MSVTMSLALYFIIWWTVLFAVLPLGVRTQGDAGEIIQGTSESAPVTPRLKRVATITTAVASAVFGVVWLVIRWKLIPLDLVGTPGG